MQLSSLLLLLCLNSVCHAGPLWNKYQHYLENPAVKRFREYLAIDTSNDNNLKHAVDFWVRQATELGLPYTLYQPAGKPVFVATLEGSDPSLPSIMLNSHMDVVKVDETEWIYPPFDAYMDENGDIYARGAQDTKDIGIQYLEAVRKLKKHNVTLARTIHITVIPDEEKGGKYGMKAFVKTKAFKDLNVGLALDEGMISTDRTYHATFVDKRAWQMEFTIRGVGGHGFMMLEGSAMDNTEKFINAVTAYRETQKQIRSKDPSDFTKFTSLNINIINGGLAENIVSTKFKVVVDMRLAMDAEPAKMLSVVKSWMREAGNNTSVKFLRREIRSGITPVDDTNPFWVTMRKTMKDLGLKFTPTILPATSDMLVLRNLGIWAFGFSTKVNTILRLHANNEYQNVVTFLKGIDVYTELIKNLANVPEIPLGDYK